MDIGDSIKLRNSLYMSLTRSFISSYLIMNSDNIKADFIDIYKDAAAEILQNGILELKEPTEEQIKKSKYFK